MMVADIQSYIVQVIGPFMLAAMAALIAVAVAIIWLADGRNLFDQ